MSSTTMLQCSAHVFVTLPCPLLQALVEPASDDEEEEEEESGSEAGSDSDVEAMSGSDAEAGELGGG